VGRLGEAVASPDLSRLALAVATVGGVGYAPVAPGTVASALTVAALWLLPFSRSALVLFFVIVTVVGTWAADRAERAIGGKDPGAIVIDEVAGMTLSVLTLPLTPAVLVVAFFLFRVFDVLKPFPAGRSQAIPGGVGVMVDDLIAALYALVLVSAARALVGVP
jgi:phosphatidylglycerophosphatase A